MPNVIYYESKLGPIGIAESDGRITHLFFQNEDFTPEGYAHGETAILIEAANQLSEYFDGWIKKFIFSNWNAVKARNLFRGR